MDNTLEGLPLTIDLNSNPMQNPTETPKSGFEEASVGEREPLLKDDQDHELIQELNRTKSELNRMKSENKKLADMLTVLIRNYNDLRPRQSEEELSRTRKRKAEDENENLGMREMLDSVFLIKIL